VGAPSSPRDSWLRSLAGSVIGTFLLPLKI